MNTLRNLVMAVMSCCCVVNSSFAENLETKGKPVNFSAFSIEFLEKNILPALRDEKVYNLESRWRSKKMLRLLSNQPEKQQPEKQQPEKQLKKELKKEQLNQIICLLKRQENFNNRNMTAAAQVHRAEEIEPLTRAACENLHNRDLNIPNSSEKLRETLEKNLQNDIEECVKRYAHIEPKPISESDISNENRLLISLLKEDIENMRKLRE